MKIDVNTDLKEDLTAILRELSVKMRIYLVNHPINIEQDGIYRIILQQDAIEIIPHHCVQMLVGRSGERNHGLYHVEMLVRMLQLFMHG